MAQDRMSYDGLRPGQEQALRSVMTGTDTLVVLPTGSGKSAIYQLAGAAVEGSTVVVSPLIALQQDQVRQTADHDVGASAAANSTQSAGQRRDRLDAFRAGDLDYLFLAPEQLHGDTLERLRETVIGLFVVDEAHCISDWGHDFRPDYLRLGAVVDDLGHPTLLALTATAAPPVREEIVRRLHMRDPQIVVRGFDRPNIHLSVRRYEAEEDRREELRRMVAAAPDPGIVYVATRKEAERLTHELRDDGLEVAHYHGGMPATDREDVHRAFLDDDLDVIVATPAFGMGIDKPNVRFVFHTHAPDSLDTYYQELGRAGRDGERSSAVLFHRDADLGLRRYLGARGGIDRDAVRALGDALADHPETHVDQLGDLTDLSASKVQIGLARLEDHGAVQVDGDGAVRICPDGDLSKSIDAVCASVTARESYERSRLEMVRAYVDTDTCRGRFLVNYFGEQLGGRCGHCDNCIEGNTGELPAEEPFPVDSRVAHGKWGVGTVVRYEVDRVTVLFDRAGYRTLALDLITEHELLQKASVTATPRRETMPIERKRDLPGTIQRSPDKAQRTFEKTYNHALDTYDGDEERARRAAYSSLKHTFEKVGDHWEPKDDPGPSDERAERGAGEPGGQSAGGVDVHGHTKKELYERAKQLGVEGRSRMGKEELARRIAQKQD